MTSSSARVGKLFARRAVLLIILVAGWFTFFGSDVRCGPEYRAVTILHTNDIHDHLLPFSYPDPADSKAPYTSMQATKNIGGIARLATLARRIEAEARGNALLLDAGDLIDGTAFTLEYAGEADFAAVSAARYDAMVTGNHDYGVSLDQFNRNVRIAGFPVLCANVRKRESGEPALPAHVIYDLQGAKIGVLGLTSTSAEHYKAVKEGLVVEDPYDLARRLVPQLKEQVDIVVVLSHLGASEDEKLAREVPGIDVIVGGHSHARLVTPKIVKHAAQPEAFWIGATVIVQAYQWGGELGRLDLRLRRNGGPFRLMSVSGSLLPVTADIPQDAHTYDVIRRYYAPIAKRYDEIVGEAAETFYDNRSGGSAVLNLVCDAIRSSTSSQIAIYGLGGIRGDILKGPIRVWDVATVLPFRNRLVILEMTGRRLKQALEGFSPGPAPGVSGMRYRMVNGRIAEATTDGKPVEDDAVYQVATIDWLVGLYFNDVSSPKYLDTLSIDALVKYIKEQHVIRPLIDGRRQVR